MVGPEALIGELADGHFVSGEDIAARLGVTRAAVWKQVRTLRARGIPVDAVRGRGYRIHGGVPLLQRDRIVEGLHLPVRTRLKQLDVEWEVDSTNTRLLAPDAAASPAVCVAEFQTAGRGRRGRVWHAPFGASVSLSLAYTFTNAPTGFSGLGLVAGIAVADALASLGYAQVKLKWPNDVLVSGAKVGGLLVESRGEAGGSTRAVIGVGINWRIPPGAFDGRVDQQWTDLAAVPVPLPSRDALVAAVINHLVGALDEFSARGFSAFHDRWAARDALAGRDIEVRLDAETVSGCALGIDGEGALRIAANGEIRRFTAGEVSVRGSA